jgi:bifunctional ADP-heptose synthase (sugar kinase/adenylyltransferase)
MDTQQLEKFRVLLIGDNCTDVYQYGTVDRISPEAPVPIVKISHQEERLGMAANVQKNLEALGLDVVPVLGPLSIKTRIVDLRSKQHILRIDDDVKSEPLHFDFRDTLFQYDAIVISDYDKGWVSYELIEGLQHNFSGPIFIDTKKQDLCRFWKCYVKVNEYEFKNRWSICENLIITKGGDGAEYRQLHQPVQVFPGEKVEVVDVCGAGDTFLSALVAEFLNTDSISEAIQFANKASAISVQHSGVYTLTEEDIESIKRM